MPLVVVTVRTAVPDPPEEIVMVDPLRLRVGPMGVMVATRLIVPAKLLTLVILRVDVPVDPASTVMLLGPIVMTKSGVVLVENVAVSVVAGVGTGVPLAMVTQMFGGTLVFVQPA